MRSYVKRLAIALVVLLTAAAPGPAAGTSDKRPPEAELSASSSPLDSNLVILASEMWIVIRYDAQSNTLVATGSDRDGVALWVASYVEISRDSSDGSVTLQGIAVLKAGGAMWVDWQKFTITLQGGKATITKTNQNGTDTYSGRAVKIKTYGGDSK